jgi:hypothetical protein
MDLVVPLPATDSLIPGMTALNTALSIIEIFAEKGLVKLKREPIERWRIVQLDILKEEAKGDKQDMALVANLYDLLKVEEAALTKYLQAGLELTSK